MDIVKEIKTVVNEFVDAEKMFTAFEITKALRAKFPRELIFHKGVRANVALMFDNGEMVDYTRTNETVSGVNVNVYHSLMDDSSTYSFVANQVASVPSISVSVGSQSVPVTTVTPTVAPASVLDEDISVTSEVRLNIPPRILSKIGAKVGDFVYVGCNGGSKLVGTINYPVGVTDVKRYKVDSDLRIRISEQMLNLVSRDETLFNVKVNSNNELEISPAN